MLSAAVLDAAEYPDISINGVAAAGAPDSGAAPRGCDRHDRRRGT